MAFIDSSKLVAYQSKTVQKEIKKPVLEAVDFMRAQTPLFKGLGADLKNAIENANGQTVSMISMKDLTTEAATEFSFDIPLNLGESASTNVTIYQFWTGFHAYKYAHAKNAISEEEYYMVKYAECDKTLAESVSAQIATIMAARRTQVLTTTGVPSGMAFNPTSDSLTIANALKATPFFDNLETLMTLNDMEGTYSMLSSIGLGFILSTHKMYGAANDKNLLAQSLPSLFYDKKITAPSGSDASGYFVKDGAFALVESYPIEFLQRASVGTTAKWDIGSMNLPLAKMRPLLYEEEYKADTNSVNSGRPTSGMTVGKKIGMGVSFAVLSSYNSDLTTRPNDVLRVDFTTA
jgi:hypothetical protein